MLLLLEVEFRTNEVRLQLDDDDFESGLLLAQSLVRLLEGREPLMEFDTLVLEGAMLRVEVHVRTDVRSRWGGGSGRRNDGGLGCFRRRGGGGGVYHLRKSASRDGDGGRWGEENGSKMGTRTRRNFGGKVGTNRVNRLSRSFSGHSGIIFFTRSWIVLGFSFRGNVLERNLSKKN